MATVAPSSEKTAPRTLTVQLDGGVQLDKSVRDALTAMDMDGDGTVTLPELLSMLKDKRDAELEASRLRTYLLVAAVLYAFTLAAIFGVSFGASSILKDAYANGGVSTTSDGVTMAQPSSFFAGETDLLDLLLSTEEQLDSIEELDLELPAGQLMRFSVSSFLATPSEDAESWEDIELYSANGMMLYIGGSNATLFMPKTDYRDAQAIDMLEELDSRRRLQQGGQGGGWSPGFGSIRQRPRPGMAGPPFGGGPSGGQMGGQGGSPPPPPPSGGQGGQQGGPGGQFGPRGGPGLPPCAQGGFCPGFGGRGGNQGSFGGRGGNQGSFGGQGGSQGNRGPPQANGFTGAQRSFGGGRTAPSGGVGRPGF